GLEVQARAMARVMRDDPDLRWVLVGPDGGAWRSLDGEIEALGLTSRVVWTGLLPHGQCLEAMADADVFLLTSRHEAHSVARNEGLAVGVPIVLTDTVQFDEVEGWGAGLVVSWEAERLAGAVRRILDSPAEAEAMRAAGRRAARERLAWPKV